MKPYKKPYKALDENMGKLFYNLGVENLSYDRRHKFLKDKFYYTKIFHMACVHTRTHHKESKNTNYNFRKISETISQTKG